MIKIILMSYFFLLAIGASAKQFTSEQKNSQIVISASKTPKGAELIFKVVPRVVKGVTMVVNDQENAPWKLKIENIKNVKLLSDNLGPEKFSLEIPGFKVSIKSETKPWSFSYKMRVFVCTKNKDRCFSEMHSGEVKS